MTGKAETNDYIQQLETMWGWYIEERRGRVQSAIDLRNANGDGGMFAPEIARANEGIKAIEEAIAHEKALLKSPTTAAFGTYGRG